MLRANSGGYDGNPRVWLAFVDSRPVHDSSTKWLPKPGQCAFGRAGTHIRAADGQAGPFPTRHTRTNSATGSFAGLAVWGGPREERHRRLVGRPDRTAHRYRSPTLRPRRLTRRPAHDHRRPTHVPRTVPRSGPPRPERRPRRAPSNQFAAYRPYTTSIGRPMAFTLPYHKLARKAAINSFSMTSPAVITHRSPTMSNIYFRRRLVGRWPPDRLPGRSRWAVRSLRARRDLAGRATPDQHARGRNCGPLVAGG